MSSKIRVLVCPSDRSGVGSFRSIWPTQHLKRFHSDAVDIHLDLSPDTKNLDYLTKFDIIHFHRMFGPYEESETLFTELRNRGVKLVMDIDDYWRVPPTHHLYPIIVADKMDEKIEKNLTLVDFVTTTTDIFADEIRKFNPNVVVLPNALNMEEPMWKSERKPDPLGRVGISWIGGSSHLHDLMKIKDSMAMLSNDNSIRDKFQFVMCGFDTRGSITEIDQNNNRSVRAIRKDETVWLDFERIFTNDYQLVQDKEYKDWLLKIENKDYPDMYSKNYIRRWTLPLTQYGKHYDYCDVCLAPLAETYEHKAPSPKKPGMFTVSQKVNMFNLMKSQLKLIESGMKKKVLIAQDFGIYKQLIEDGVTGILVNKNDDRKGWYKAIKSVVTNEDYRNELANNLHEFVKDRYDITTVNKARLEFYQKLVEEKQPVEALKQSA